MWSFDYAPPFEEALKINGLNTELLKKHGDHPTVALKKVALLFNEADVIMAHNGLNFDKPILINQAARYKVPIPDKTWLDPRTDFDYPTNITSKRLCHLVIDHGGAWDHELAHTALYDVMKMLIFAKNYDLEEAFKKAQSPVIRVEAANLPRERNNEAKTRRYFWDPIKKVWAKNIREIDYEKEKEEAGFNVRKG